MPRRRAPKRRRRGWRVLLGVLVGTFLGMVLVCGGVLLWPFRPVYKGNPVVGLLLVVGPILGGLLGAPVGGLIGWFGLTSTDRAGQRRWHWLEGLLGMAAALAGTILFGPADPPSGFVAVQLVAGVIGVLLGMLAGAIIAARTRAPLIDLILPRWSKS